MPNYKKMYLEMFRASEKAVNILIAAQQECEELYLADSETEFNVMVLSPESKKNVDKE